MPTATELIEELKRLADSTPETRSKRMQLLVTPTMFDTLKALSSETGRGVAQFGSATGLGPVGRGFKSCHPDHFSQ